ncbi:glycerol-3-phosphate dehydrogenase [NAD(+)] 2, chloroplastic-like [Papaver somniferum]|uniref:glycerol-3-phosphate dehydrogenase [NAD(+)] 2, chloroplastic-like n=1 Tax=Papaver somniferum TaxID=3469 RepID=UPI000E6FD65B|nr:glycerol-3-phosphate dehydrogenase [NAD(+)] 2, chloroplastic-like [Papaver somniferum]XP_026457155.1 glycerol-3-phosphate dehydrogenase [NAD(+)] 2, chloroplastic-like [Papaver somniferum]
MFVWVLKNRYWPMRRKWHQGQVHISQNRYPCNHTQCKTPPPPPSSQMAALLEPPPFSNLHLSSSSSSSISFHTQKPNFLRLQNNQSKSILLYLYSPPLPLLKPLYCSASSSGAIDPPQPKPPPIENIPNPSPSGGERRDSISCSSSGSTNESRKKDRRKTVKLAWEKLVRWSRSWRNKNKTDVLQRTKKVVVLGGGSFGTAMAAHVANNKAEMEVTMLLRDPVVCLSINESHYNCKYFPEHKLPDNVIATTDAKTALDGADFCLHAVPVQFSSSFLEDISEHVNSSLPIISLSKGLELNTLRMMSQIIPQALGNPRQPFVALSGPSFALELMKKLPTAMVVASKDRKLASSVQQLLSSQHLRISTSSDVTGVEIAGALKNVLAIAAGIVDGMDLGNNSMAALVAQGCSEIRWLATKMGGKAATITGLSGSGDIMLTCFVNLSRNRTLGVRLGRGETLDDILSSMNQVAEGVSTAGAVIALAQKYNVKMPVLTAVARIIDNELTPQKAVLELMGLPQVEEV